MICDFCLMERIILLKLPIDIIVEDKVAKHIQWGKKRAICSMCIEVEGALCEE